MTTKAEREAAYQALVKLGVPIPPNEIDAVLEAAEGARGAPARDRADEVLAELVKLRAEIAALPRPPSTAPRMRRVLRDRDGRITGFEDV